MDTYKPISTIGYNSEEFLVDRLNELVNLYPDLFYCYIYHDNEPNKKIHYHLYVEPNDRIRTDDFKRIKQSFEEFDENNEKPLGIMSFRKSDFENWYLYSVHDETYLRSKHIVKQVLNYDTSLVKTNNNDILLDNISLIDITTYLSPIDKMSFCFNNNMSMIEAMSYLRIPYSAMYGFMKVWNDALRFKREMHEIITPYGDEDAPPPYEDKDYYLDLLEGGQAESTNNI